MGSTAGPRQTHHCQRHQHGRGCRTGKKKWRSWSRAFKPRRASFIFLPITTRLTVEAPSQGRQLEYAPPPLATLLRINRERPDLLQDPNFQIHIDGGIRRGTDVLKAMCLGASSVGLGRAVLYSQTCYGDQGVQRMLQILTDEVQAGMRLLGAKKVGDLHPGLLELLPSPNALEGERLKER